MIHSIALFKPGVQAITSRLGELTTVLINERNICHMINNLFHKVLASMLKIHFRSHRNAKGLD